MSELTLYGQGSCAIDGRPIRRGLLMCGEHWRKVPAELRAQIYTQLARWNAGNGTLGELQEVQERAIDAVTGDEPRQLSFSAPVPDHGGYCPGCGRVMSKRERAEQGACNDCNGGAWSP